MHEQGPRALKPRETQSPVSSQKVIRQGENCAQEMKLPIPGNGQRCSPDRDPAVSTEGKAKLSRELESRSVERVEQEEKVPA